MVIHTNESARYTNAFHAICGLSAPLFLCCSYHTNMNLHYISVHAFTCRHVYTPLHHKTAHNDALNNAPHNYALKKEARREVAKRNNATVRGAMMLGATMLYIAVVYAEVLKPHGSIVYRITARRGAAFRDAPARKLYVTMF